jgi:hypothetical protein
MFFFPAIELENPEEKRRFQEKGGRKFFGHNTPAFVLTRRVCATPIRWDTRVR